MTDDQEREDLEDLVESAGWRRFKLHVTEELDTGYLDVVSRAVVEAGDDVQALSTIKQLASTREHLRKMLAWPKERLRILKTTEPRGRSRRGGL